MFFSAVAPVAVLTAAAFSKSWIEPLLPGNFTLAHFRSALLDDQIAVRGIVNSFSSRPAPP